MPLVNDHRDPSEPAATADFSRVLVVEDNVVAAKISATLLREFGYDVRTAHSGETALELALGFRPRAVLLDIGLPKMDGYEVAGRFRQHPQLKDMRLIAVTGYGQESDRQRAKEAGFDHHLVKPVEPDHLLKLLADLTTRSSRRQSEVEPPAPQPRGNAPRDRSRTNTRAKTRTDRCFSKMRICE